MTQLSRREGAAAPLETEAAGFSRGGEAGVRDFQNPELSRAFHLECLGICEELMEGAGAPRAKTKHDPRTSSLEEGPIMKLSCLLASLKDIKEERPWPAE